MKKLFISFLLVLTTIFTLASCGKSSSAASEPAQASTTTANPTRLIPSTTGGVSTTIDTLPTAPSTVTSIPSSSSVIPSTTVGSSALGTSSTATSVPTTIFTSASCGKSSRDYFTLWNDCDSLTTLINYVEDVTNKNSKNYIPVEDRIATFDMDGTFIGELYASYFEYNMLEYRVLDDPTYVDKDPSAVEAAQNIRDFVRTGKALPSGFDMIHAHAAAKAYAGMSVAEFDEYVKEYAKKTPFGFTGMTYATSFYKPMLEVFKYLEANDFTYYVVSGSDRFICRALVESIGIPANRVIGMDVVLKSSKQGDKDGVSYTMSSDEYLIRTDELIIKNLKTNKVKQIVQEIGKTPVLSFGNSSGDSAMHNFCKSNEKYKTEVFMLIADDTERDHANLVETAKRKQAWEDAHYNIISMLNDFKTIYGDGVTKVDFVF